jgi:hypothetical protein
MDFKRQEKPSNGIGVVTSLFASSPALLGFFMPKKEPAEAPSPLTE